MKTKFRIIQKNKSIEEPKPEDKYKKNITEFKQKSYVNIDLNPDRISFQESTQLSIHQKIAHNSLTVHYLTLAFLF